MKLYWLECKQFLLVDSTQFGQVRLAILTGAVKIVFGQRWFGPPIKMARSPVSRALQ